MPNGEGDATELSYAEAAIDKLRKRVRILEERNRILEDQLNEMNDAMQRASRAIDEAIDECNHLLPEKKEQ